MKKYIVFLLLSLVAISCYDSYITDYTYDGIYFPYQVDVRTFVVGEGMKIEVGASLGGVHENTHDRTVNFILDDALITPEILFRMKNVASDYIRSSTETVTNLLPLPSGYYNISNISQMVIKAGQHMGSVVIKADSTTFVSDPATLVATYVLPFHITSADADSVLHAKNYNIVGLKYENMLFGNYWHGGITIRKDAVGATIDTVVYHTQIPMIESKIWKLKTVGPNVLVTNGFSNQTSQVKNEMTLTLNGGTITVSSASGATNVIQPEGTSTYNQAKLLQDRKIFLNYQYTQVVGAVTYYCHATDTLTFRNRLRDGINEWQDENPSHYTR